MSDPHEKFRHLLRLKKI